VPLQTIKSRQGTCNRGFSNRCNLTIFCHESLKLKLVTALDICFSMDCNHVYFQTMNHPVQTIVFILGHLSKYSESYVKVNIRLLLSFVNLYKLVTTILLNVIGLELLVDYN